MDLVARRASLSLVLLLIVAVLSASLSLPPQVLGQSTPHQSTTIWLPIVNHNLPILHRFGVEWNQSAASTAVYTQKTKELGTPWVRFHRLSWRAVQPTEGGPYDWSVLSTFEDELRAARQAGLTPMVVVQHSPLWATVNTYNPTDCGAIRADKLDSFAQFMLAAVNRYKQPEFDVHYWELFNEPDVDPRLVPPDHAFGCWGDINDPYYGGRAYGAMLQAVTPAMRAADPNVQVIIGGLLLDRPVPEAGQGHPERFLEGILVAGAAHYFDIVAYHAYPSWIGQPIDHDLMPSYWQSLGGWTLGKARFLRNVLAAYSISKPLFLNETSLVCNPDQDICDPPPADFYEAQASFVTRTFARSQSEAIWGPIWYTLNGPAWRYGGLLDAQTNPQPAYWAYQELARQLKRATFESAVDYGSDVEAYSFVRDQDRVHVIWSGDNGPDVINVPQAQFLAALDRDGNALTPLAADPYYQFTVGFSPIYVILRR